MKVIPYDRYARLRDSALRGGAKGPPMALTWALHGRCSNPYELRFQPSRSLTEGYVDLITPCRNCQHCLQRRARFWAAKAGIEYARAPRTWFATYTFGPHARGRLYTPLQGVSDAAERRARLINASGVYLSRYLKRLRKKLAGDGISIRYMLVPELHKDGTPHWHALLHTQASWRSLAKPWVEHGFFHGRIVRPDEAVKQIRYAAKYLAKAKLGRVRASVRYGLERPDGISREETTASETPRLYIPTTIVEAGEEAVSWFNQLVVLLADAGYSLVPEGDLWDIQPLIDVER